MTDDEQAALAWIDWLADTALADQPRKHAITLKRMLQLAMHERRQQQTSMTDEQAPLAWLDGQKVLDWLNYLAMDPKHPAATLKRMLAQPRLPEEPSEEMISALHSGYRECSASSPENWLSAYRALYQHLTKPRTKTLEVWYVHYAGFVLRTSGRRWERLVTVHGTEDEANRAAFDYEAEPSHYRHVRVTGPHAQEVPV